MSCNNKKIDFVLLLFLANAINVAFAGNHSQVAKGTTAKSMEHQGMVNIKNVDSTIEVSLMYARKDNFTGEVLYDNLRQAYLHPKAADALARAQKYLKRKHPELSLRIYDACRPMSIQRKMWDKVKNTKKYFYVSNPAHGGGLHNYGMAVDISICRVGGDTIHMGTKVDCMNSLAHIDREDYLVKTRRMSRQAVENRRLLRQVMRQAGFTPLRTEWWHFNYCTRKYARAHYKVIK